MPGDLSEAAQDFAGLARNLIAVGAGELRRELYKAISDAAEPAVDEVKSLANLEAHMPSGYAPVLRRDLQVTTHSRAVGPATGVTILARAPTVGRGGRKVRQLDEGRISHPLFGDREFWFVQTRGMVPGFFTGPCEAAAPEVRQAIIAAVTRTEEKALRR